MAAAAAGEKGGREKKSGVTTKPHLLKPIFCVRWRPPRTPRSSLSSCRCDGAHTGRVAACVEGEGTPILNPHTPPPPPPSQSAVEPEFWEALGAKKLDEWKLSEAPVEIQGE